MASKHNSQHLWQVDGTLAGPAEVLMAACANVRPVCHLWSWPRFQAACPEWCVADDHARKVSNLISCHVCAIWMKFA